MSSFNKVVLLGHLTRDPEIRYTPNELAVATFGLAVNEVRVSNGEKKESVSFIDIVVYGKTAENCGKYVFKGDLLLIEGKIRQRRWDDKDTGAKRSKIEVVAQTVTFMPKVRREAMGSDQDRQEASEAIPVDEGEIPF